MNPATPNPLLALLLRREQWIVLTWRLTVLLAGLVTLSGVAILLALMVRVDDYYAQQDYAEYFGYAYLAFLAGSAAFPLFIAVFAAIFTALWIRRDEKFDLLRLTELRNRQFVQACFWGVLHRLRIPIVLHVIPILLFPLIFDIIIYWENQPHTTYYGSYSYEDAGEQVSIFTYGLFYSLALLFHVVLVGANLTGAAAGVWAGLRFRQWASAIASAGGATFLTMLLYGGITAGGVYLLVELLGNSDMFNDDEAIMGLLCLNTWGIAVWMIPPIFVLKGYFKIGARVVRRD